MDIEAVVKAALAEDLGEKGDVTTNAICDPSATCKAEIVVKSDGVLCGLDITRKVFEELDPDIKWHTSYKDGDQVHGRCVIVELEGKTCAILSAERTALNFLQRLSGMATGTAAFVDRAKGKVKILDTRKTVPLHRELNKYAVRVGGGQNHRMGLHDMVMIKDNHIAVAGSVAAAVGKAREKNPDLKIEAEAKTLAQVQELIDLNVNRIMLDNMSLTEMKKAVELIRSVAPGIEIEASGGVTIANIPDIADTGVDFISVGSLTHSAQAMDISLDIVNSN